MNPSVDIAASYTGKTVGRLFAGAELKAVRDNVTEMIKEAGLAGKIAALIIPNDFHRASYSAVDVDGSKLVTLWGRTPESDLPAVMRLISDAKSKHGTKFTACDSRVYNDVVIQPYFAHGDAPVPPRTWT